MTWQRVVLICQLAHIISMLLAPQSLLFLLPLALFLWRRPVVGLCPRGVAGIYFGSFQHWAGCRLNRETVKASLEPVTWVRSPTRLPSLLVVCVCTCQCVCMCETYGVLQHNTEHPTHAWLMSETIVTVPAGQMKRYESAGRLGSSSGYRQFCQRWQLHSDRADI